MRTLRTNLGFLMRSSVAVLVLGVLLLNAHVSIGQTSTPTQPEKTTPPLRPLGETPLVTDIDLVTVMVSVTDRAGRHVSGLDKTAFTVYDDKLPQQVSFFSDADTPISLAVIFDTSDSMRGDKIMRAREALARFVETSHRADEYFLISFSDRAQLLLDRTLDASAVLAKFTYVAPRGKTALYDATYLGLEKVARGSRPKRVILLITDGNDTSSLYTLKELRQSLQESDVVVYAIGIFAFSRSEAARGRTTLKQLVSVTGGKAFFPDNTTQMFEAFERIALELRSQYSIGYRPTDLTRDRRWHRIKVDIKLSDSSRLVVRNREGFYAPE